MSDHPFYGETIARGAQEKYIKNLLEDLLTQPASDELKEQVYWRLAEEKHAGRVTIPYKVILQKDESGAGNDYIEVVLDSKV